MKDEYNNLIEYIGITNSIDEDYEIFTEKSIENYLIVKNPDIAIKEITQVFVSCDILNHTLIKGFNAHSVDGSKISDNICFIEGMANFSLQYIDDSTSDVCSISKDNEYFSTFIVIPEDCVLRGDIEVKSYISNAMVNKIDDYKIFYYIHIFIALSVY